MINFCWHKWGKWEKFEKKRTKIASMGESLYDFIMIQERRCEKCGKYQVKEMYWND